MFVTMLNLFRLELAQQYLWGLAWVGLSMVPPFVVFKIISFAQDLSSYNRNEALFYVAALLASVVVRSAGMFLFVYSGTYAPMYLQHIFMTGLLTLLSLRYVPISSAAWIAHGTEAGYKGNGHDKWTDL